MKQRNVETTNRTCATVTSAGNAGKLERKRQIRIVRSVRGNCRMLTAAAAVSNIVQCSV